VSRRIPTNHSDPTYRLLEQIEASPDVSQRSIASSLGIALGLTNSLVRGLIHRGWVRAINIKPHRVQYLITPTGIAEKARLSRAAFRNSVERFAVARERVQETFHQVSREWPGPVRNKPIIFYGAGEVAEIGYICLQETDLNLIAVIDDQGRSRFFGVPVYPASALREVLTAAPSEARIIVMSLAQTETIREDLAAIPDYRNQVTWV